MSDTQSNRVFDIAVLPGDGIGVEVMQACLQVLEATERVCGGASLRCRTHEAGAQHYARTGVALPPGTLEACRSADAILFGAMGWPDIRYPDGTEPIPQLDLRMALGLYAGVRPIRWFPGLPRVLVDERSKAIDFVLIREQTEGLFYARGRGRMVGDEEAYDTMQITRADTSASPASPSAWRPGAGHRVGRQGSHAWTRRTCSPPWPSSAACSRRWAASTRSWSGIAPTWTRWH